MKFQVCSQFEPAGDQPQAIKKLVAGYAKHSQQTLLGVTGSGKTFTLAKVIEKVQKPTLVLAHNKTLAAQLYNEFKMFFPNNKVCYFISYYDYYQPESYLPISDTYIEKDTSINEKIEQLRLETAGALMSRSDVIVVASISCIYGFGSPKSFLQQAINIKLNEKLTREELLKKLVSLLFVRDDLALTPGKFQARGNLVNLISGDGKWYYRLEFDEEKLVKIGISETKDFDYQFKTIDQVFIFPAKPFVFNEEQSAKAIESIKQELAVELAKIKDPLIAHRLKQRTNYDLEMIKELGFCNGIENYSRHFDNRLPGVKAYTLLDYFKFDPSNKNKPRDFLFVIDESHVSLPQAGGMYFGDYTRKKNLVDYGFRLPSAFDNRPLKFAEFEEYLEHAIYVSATPADYELQHSGQVVEQIVRPTGIVDPEIFVRPITGQMADLSQEINQTIKQNYRVLITTLTKRMAEDLTDYLLQHSYQARYLHSEIDALERTDILRDLRLGKFDILVGINLLREGLDLPEVGLVAILDADKEGFLRNTRSLIQTIGRAARNIDSKVILYADQMTKSIKQAIKETDRRRKIQQAYNKKHHITPQSIKKEISAKLNLALETAEGEGIIKKKIKGVGDVKKLIIDLESQMSRAAEELDFEQAIKLRDQIKNLKGDWGLDD